MPDHICTSPQCQTTAGCKCNPILRGAREALAVASGEAPAAAFYHQGHKYVAANEITALREENERLKAELANARREALEEAAHIGYRICAETRHVRLGDSVRAAIRAAKETGPACGNNVDDGP